MSKSLVPLPADKTQIGLNAQPWHGFAWAVIAGCTLILAAVAPAAYRRDSGRV